MLKTSIYTLIGLMFALSANCAESKYPLSDQFLPTVRVHAEYPQEAFNKGVGGFCSIIFDVTESGSVKNQRILTCSEEGYFEKSVGKAISLFKYKAPLPYQINGVIEFFWFSPEINSDHSHIKNLGVSNVVYCDRSNRKCKAYMSVPEQDNCLGC